MSRYRAGYRVVSAAVLLTVLLALALLSGCTSDAASDSSPFPSSLGTSPDSTGTRSTATRPVTSRWPPGMEAVVLGFEGGYSVLDAGGVRFQEVPPAPETSTTVTIRGIPTFEGVRGLVVSEAAELLAYAQPGEDLVVRSLADGAVLYQMKVDLEGQTTLGPLSNDGRLLALVTVDPELAKNVMREQVPWTVTILDLARQRLMAAQSLADLVRQRIDESPNRGCGLTKLAWLPGDILLVGVSGELYESYLCDPLTDTMELVADLQTVWEVSPEGLVLGKNLDTGQSLVWRDGTIEPVVSDPAWPYTGSGCISTDGKALVLWVSKTGGGLLTDPHGWQRFAKVGSEWHPNGQVAEVGWMNQPPGLASGDGRVAWAFIYQSTADNATVLLSHDFGTGLWEEWFRPEDLEMDLGSFSFVGLLVGD